MTTNLRKKPMLREVSIEGEAFTVTISNDGVYLARKRFRSGAFYSWRELWKGGARSFAIEKRPGDA